jgi:hypothetical protein
MWEEHPAYQKIQATMVGLLVCVLFIGGVLYCTSTRDWDSLRLVIYAAAGLVVTLAIFPLAALLIVKAVARRRASQQSCDRSHEV